MFRNVTLPSHKWLEKFKKTYYPFYWTWNISVLIHAKHALYHHVDLWERFDGVQTL